MNLEKKAAPRDINRRNKTDKGCTSNIAWILKDIARNSDIMRSS